MFSDLITFFNTLTTTALPTGSESVLPDSLKALQGDTVPIETLSNLLANIDTTYKIVGAVISLIIALVGCFFGFKLSKLFMSLTGFLCGTAIGYLIATRGFHLSGGFLIACTIFGGIVLAMMSYWIYRAGIFILCFGLAFVAAASLFPFTGDVQFFLCTVIGFGIGSLALKFIRPVIIITSAVVGGTSASGLLLTVSSYLNLNGPLDKIPQFMLTLILCGLGIFVQFLTTKDPAEKKAHKH